VQVHLEIVRELIYSLGLLADVAEKVPVRYGAALVLDDCDRIVELQNFDA